MNKTITGLVLGFAFACAAPSIAQDTSLPPASDRPSHGVAPSIQEVVIDYLEHKKEWPSGETAFVICDFLGLSETAGNIEVYAYHFSKTFKLVDNQVLSCGGRAGPVVVYVTRSENGLRASGSKHPQDGSEHGPSIRRMFPSEYHENYRNQDRMMIMSLALRERVRSYYSAQLDENRFIDKLPPTTNDAHGHEEPIYEYRNLKDSYRQVRCVAVDDLSTIGRTSGVPSHSPDNRFEAWVGVDGEFHLYFRDVFENRVYEVVNLTKSWMTHIAWRGDNVLVVDQNNGPQEVHKHDWRSPDSIHGIHFEMQLDQREIVWAVPFGDLAFPSRVSD